MKNKVKPTILPGFAEYLPADQMAFNRILDDICQTFELFGFIPLDTPAVEKAEVLLAKGGGETEKQVYRIKKGDNDLVLRFDLTVSLARYIAQRYNDLSFPFKRYQIGKVWRGERQQKGRFREFYQCDIDIINKDKLDLINDAEIAAVIYAVFKKLNLGDFTIKISNRKIINGILEQLGIAGKSVEILRAIDKLAKVDEKAVIKELEGLGIDKDKIQQLLQFIKTSDIQGIGISNKLFTEGMQELWQVLKYIKNLGVPEKNIVVDLSIIRGLDYYTGIVYETFLDNYPDIGSVCSGGRYDNLAENYTDKKFPGVGMSIGLTRLFYQLKEAGLIKNKKATPSQALIVPMVDDLKVPLETAAKLRSNNIKTEVYFDASVKAKKKFAYADKTAIPYVIAIGDEEIKNNIITLKDMKTGEQKQATIEEVIKIIKK